MPQLSSVDATYHAAKYLIYALYNPELAYLLVKLGHGPKEALKTLTDIFRKAKTPELPSRVPVREVGQKNSKK